MRRLMLFAVAVVAAGAACVTPTGERAEPVAPSSYNPAPSTPVDAGGGWVIESVGYSRGPDEHYVTCVLPGTDHAEVWREVLIDAAHAYDDTYVEGEACPAGVVRATTEGS